MLQTKNNFHKPAQFNKRSGLISPASPENKCIITKNNQLASLFFMCHPPSPSRHSSHCAVHQCVKESLFPVLCLLAHMHRFRFYSVILHPPPVIPRTVRRIRASRNLCFRCCAFKHTYTASAFILSSSFHHTVIPRTVRRISASRNLCFRCCAFWHTCTASAFILSSSNLSRGFPRLCAGHNIKIQHPHFLS